MKGNRARRRQPWGRRRENGSVSAEVAIAAPALMLLILVAVQFGLWCHASNVVRTAGREGVRAARVHGADAAAGRDEARRVLDQVGGRLVVDAHVTVTRTATSARVEVLGSTPALVPGLHLPVRALAVSPVEEFRAVPRGSP